MNVCWNITNVCNENCKYCFRELYEKPRSLKYNIEILHILKEYGITGITFAGGEPLLYKDLPILIEECAKIGMKVRIITNGTNLRKENLSDYLKYASKLTFSIDSTNEYINVRNGHKKTHYSHIKELLPDIRESYPELPIEINTVASTCTLSEIDHLFYDIVTNLAKYNISKWKISRFCPIRGLAKERPYLGLSASEFEEIKEKYDNKCGLFEISVRDFEQIHDNILVTPAGTIKTMENGEEITIKDPVNYFNESSYIERGRSYV